RGGQMSVHAVVLGTALVAENTASVLCLHVHYTVAFPHSLGTVCGTQCPLSAPPHSHTHTHTHTYTHTMCTHIYCGAARALTGKRKLREKARGCFTSNSTSADS